MSKTAQKLQEWMASRKFALLIAYWFFCYAGAAVMYFFDCTDFEDVLEVYNSANDWAWWGLITFAGVEGGKEMIGMVRGKKPIPAPTPYDPDKTEVI